MHQNPEVKKLTRRLLICVNRGGDYMHFRV